MLTVGTMGFSNSSVGYLNYPTQVCRTIGVKYIICVFDGLYLFILLESRFSSPFSFPIHSDYYKSRLTAMVAVRHAYTYFAYFLDSFWSYFSVIIEWEHIESGIKYIQSSKLLFTGARCWRKPCFVNFRWSSSRASWYPWWSGQFSSLGNVIHSLRLWRVSVWVWDWSGSPWQTPQYSQPFPLPVKYLIAVCAYYLLEVFALWDGKKFCLRKELSFYLSLFT